MERQAIQLKPSSLCMYRQSPVKLPDIKNSIVTKQYNFCVKILMTILVETLIRWANWMAKWKWPNQSSSRHVSKSWKTLRQKNCTVWGWGVGVVECPFYVMRILRPTHMKIHYTTITPLFNVLAYFSEFAVSWDRKFERIFDQSRTARCNSSAAQQPESWEGWQCCRQTGFSRRRGNK